MRAILPIPSGEPLDLRITCESCGARYAVLGSGFFCPACGHSSALSVFEDSLRKVRLKVQAARELKDNYAEIGSRDDAEVLARSLLETALVDSVVAFQRFCEELYRSHPEASSPPLNAFQRIDQGGDLWRDLLGETYEDWLSDDQLVALKVYFQRRHLLQHTEGVVDERYLERSGDTAYRVGQRIVVKPKDVLELAEIIERLGGNLRSRM